MLYDSPVRDLTTHMLSLYVGKKTVLEGTIVARTLPMGLSPIKCLLANMSNQRRGYRKVKMDLLTLYDN